MQVLIRTEPGIQKGERPLSTEKERQEKRKTENDLKFPRMSIL